MSTSRLKRTKVSISYGTTCGINVKYDAKGGAGTKFLITDGEVPPHVVLIDAIGQLARITAIYGYEDAALEEFLRKRDEVFEIRRQEGLK